MDQSNQGKIAAYGPLFIRIGLAAVFLVHGGAKFMNMENITMFFTKAGIPLPGITSWLVAIFEFGGGLLVLLGVFTNIGAAMISVVMVGAMIYVKFSQGFMGGWEFDLVLLLMAVSLFFTGSGRYGVEDFQQNKASI